jgi:phage shock protein PspC (stress-responsive transcriptional regulator)
MNEIKRCSLAGISFTLEPDAYDTLKGFIQSLEDAYRINPDGEEIVADIEARIAEIILSTIPAEAVVTNPLVKNIIKQLGSAEQIDSEQPDHEAEPHQTETTGPSGNPRIPRRLYRDVQHNKLGGVCAGIANYFDTDPTWIRLIALIPLILWLSGLMHMFVLWRIESFMGQLTGLVALGYVVMWFTIPPASTARQKLEMRGERITTESIRENIEQATAEQRSRTLLADIVNIIGKILLIGLKIVAALMLVGLVLGVCVLGMVAIAGIPMLGFNLPTGISLVAFFCVAIIPLVILIYLIIMLLLSQRPRGRVMLVAFIVWLVSLVGMTLSAIKSPARFENSIMNVFDSVFEHDDEILYKEFTAEEIEAWRKEQQQAVEDIEKNGEAILKELEEQAEQHLSQLEDI